MDRLEVIQKLIVGAQKRLEQVALFSDHPTVTNVTKRSLKSAIGAVSELDHHVTSQIQGQEVLPDPDDNQENLPIETGKTKKEKKERKAKKEE